MTRTERIISKLVACYHIMRGQGKPSFSQFGEDRILQALFTSLGIERPTYIDIGANEPVLDNNTYLFYNRGARRICIEPEPVLFNRLRTTRRRDTCLNVGIGFAETESTSFYVFPPKYSGWNTFNKEEAELRKANGISYVKVIQVPLKNINSIMADILGGPPDLMSIDVEGR